MTWLRGAGPGGPGRADRPWGYAPRTGQVPERLSERPTVTSRTGVLNARAEGRSTHIQAAPAFAGIDWSWQHHALCVSDAEGRRIQEATRPHSRPGLARITCLLHRLGVARVGIERGDGPVVEHLLRGGFEVVVISARQVKSLRVRPAGRLKCLHGDREVLLKISFCGLT